MAEYIRMIKRNLQTAVHRYADPDTDRRVTVIGACHIGTPQYFTELRAVIDQAEADGAVVQSEGSRLLPCDDADITSEEQELLTQKRRCDDLEKRRLAELGWIDQTEGLGYPSRWQVIDLNYLQILRRLGAPAWRRQTDGKARMFAWPDTDRNGVNRLRLLIAIGLRVLANEKRMNQLSGRDPADDILIHARTAVALDGAADAGQHVVLVWGVAHLPGIDAGLREAGFTRTGEPEWHTVMKVPALPSALYSLIVRRPPPASTANR